MRAKKAVKDIQVDLQHWSWTVACYDDFLYGYPLLRLLPDLEPGHGTKLRVTVEVIDSGKPCSVRRWRDGEKCSR